MKTRILLLIAICLTVGFLIGYYKPYTSEGYNRILDMTREATAKKGVLPTKAIPFKVADRWGETITIGHTPWKDGKALMVLHIWGPWCAPCRTEFLPLVEFAEANPDVWFMTISVGSEMKYVDKFLESIRFKEDYSRRKLFAFVGSEKEKTFANDYYQINAFPATIFLDKEGNIVKRILGAIDWKDPSVQEFLNTLKSEPSLK